MKQINGLPEKVTEEIFIQTTELCAIIFVTVLFPAPYI